MQTSADIKSERNQGVEKRHRRRKNAPKRGRMIGAYKGKFFLDERKEEIKQLLMQDIPFTYIADKMQVSVSNLHYYLKKHPSLIPEKYQRKRVRSKLYHKEAYILQELNAGTPKAVIARELAVSREALFNKLAQMGWKETNPYRKKKIDLNLFLKAFREGKTYREMANLFQCHPKTIQNKVKELRFSRNRKAAEREEKSVVCQKQQEECYR